MKHFVLLSIFCGTSFLSLAQDNQEKNLPVNSQSVVRINLLGIPAFSFEKGLGKNFSFRPEAGLGWLVITNEKSEDPDKLKIESFVNPYVLLEGRYYYNMDRRTLKGKRVEHFAADYLAVFYRYNAYEYQAGLSEHNRNGSGKLSRDVQYLGTCWGMQRNLWKKQLFYINWALGPSIKTNWKEYAYFSFTCQLGFGLQW